MADRSSNSVKRLLAAIGYPERMSDGSVQFTLRVDGMEVVAEEFDGRLVLSHALSNDDSLLPTLSTYAAGRMLREDAVLAYDKPLTILWQDASAGADSEELTRLFETFMNSCEWWRDRVDALSGNEPGDQPAEKTMMIRP